MGLIENQTIEVVITPISTTYYESKGYKIPKHVNKNGKVRYSIGEKIKVRAEDLSPHNRNKVWLKCDRCGEEYSIEYNSYHKSNHNGKTYCKKCAPKIFISGENNHMWKAEKTQEEREKRRAYSEYYDFVNRVIARDNYTCVSCGAVGGKLEVHHLESFASNKELRTVDSNGVTLCKECHKNFHLNYGNFDNTKEQFVEWIGWFEQKDDYNGEIRAARKVYVYEDDKTFRSAYECGKYLGVDRSRVLKVCNNFLDKKIESNGKERFSECITVCGKHVFWLDEYEKMTDDEIFLAVNKKPSSMKKVVCVNTGEVFDSIQEAKDKYGATNIGGCCCGKAKSSGKDSEGNPLIWQFYDEYLTNPKKYDYKWNNFRSVICVNTGEVFKTIAQANVVTGADVNSIRRSCKTKRNSAGKDKNGKPLYWMYYEEYIKQQENLIKEE